MPIKNLTDRGLAFPEIGSIRKGAPKGEKSIGKDLTYFRVEFDVGDKTTIEHKGKQLTTTELFLAYYPGGQPSQLNIVLPFSDIDRCWDAYLEGYTAGRLVARADGEKLIYHVNTKTGDILVKDGFRVGTNEIVPYTPKMQVGKDYKDNPIFCKPVGRLKVVLPELQRFGYMTLHTSSIYDISNISSQLEAIKQLCNQMGKGLAGVPLILRRRPKDISCPEIVDGKRTGKRVRREKYLVSVEADPDFVKRALIAMKRLALPGNGLPLLEDSPDIREPEYADDIPDDQEDEDVIEGEAIEQEEQTQPVQETRPYAPEVLKSKIAELIKDIPAMRIASETDRAVLAKVLDQTFNGQSTMRYELCKWLVGEASTKKMLHAQVLALLTWQDVKNYNDIPSEYAISETRTAHSFALESQGQQKLPI